MLHHTPALHPPLPPTLVLTPTSRRPTTLPDETVRTVLAAPIPTTAAVHPSLGVPRVSIVVVTFDNLVFTRMCLESVLANTEAPAYELIVVDNASTDGTVDYLSELGRCHPHVRVVFNGQNRGFAPANNQGLSLARGDVLVLLNNDTIVPPGWLDRLTRHLDDPAIGLVGPVTNRIGNEAQIDTSYDTYGDLLDFARAYTAAHGGERFPIQTLTMFCLAMRRDTFEQLGPLDERYRVGMLEDDDYSMSARAAGYEVVCVQDVFVHHFGEASFGKLVPTGEHGDLLRENQRRFHEKWGVAWQPYRRRPTVEYHQLAERVRALVQEIVPPGGTVAVVSRGDERLLEFDDRRGWHFPRADDGSYAGCYPADSDEAIAQLEALRTMGAQFLLFPSTAFWWLEYYPGLSGYLEQRSGRVHGCDACSIYALSSALTHPDAPAENDP